MRSIGIIALLASSFVLGGCGGDETQTTGGGTTGTPGEAANTLTVHTGEFTVPAGDSFECFYTDTITDKEMNVDNATASQGPGGHHVIVYYTDVQRKATHHPCVDSEMTSWHQIIGGGPEGSTTAVEGIATFPPGIAVKVPAGVQLVVQSHYINTTGASETVNDAIHVHLVDSKDVKAYANYHIVLDDQFEVPPQAKYSSQTTCTVDRDLDVVTLLGHMHEAGKHFKLERAPGEKQPYTTLYETDWTPLDVTHPPVDYFKMEAPLHIPKGTKLRQTCTWDNTGADPLLFPKEMCLSYMYYFPDQGELTCPPDPAPAAP
jgi:hypothetical protein